MEAINIIPKTVKICGIPYEVEICSDDWELDEINFGQIKFKECKILINDSACEAMQEQTLVHEIVHGMLMQLGYQEYSLDEKFVQALAMAINQSFDVRGVCDG